MGSQIVKEHKTYYDNGKLHTHYFTKGRHMYGEYLSYYEDGMLHHVCYYDTNGRGHNAGKLIVCSSSYYNNGKLHEETHYKDGKVHGDYKQYDSNGFLVTHNIYNNNKLLLYASHRNNRLYCYEIYHNVICNYKLYNHYKCINMSIINSIRVFQRHFRYRMYILIIGYLNDVIEISDVSKIVVSYISVDKRGRIID